MDVNEGKLGSISASLQHFSAPIAEADDPMTLFTSILKDIAEVNL